MWEGIFTIPAILGFMFVIVGTMWLRNIAYELALFSAVFGGIEIWHYHGTAFLGLPALPMWVLQFAAAGALVWVFFKATFILSLIPIPIFQEFFQIISAFVNGE